MSDYRALYRKWRPLDFDSVVGQHHITDVLKYQIANGSEIDQMLGQWHANLLGLGDIFDKEQRKTALASMLKNNFKPNLREFANMWRVFALNDEGGSIIYLLIFRIK